MRKSVVSAKEVEYTISEDECGKNDCFEESYTNRKTLQESKLRIEEKVST